MMPGQLECVSQPERLAVNDTLHAHAYYYFVRLFGYEEQLTHMSQHNAERLFHTLLATVPDDLAEHHPAQVHTMIDATLYFIKGATYEQVAEQLRIAPATVQSFIDRYQSYIRQHHTRRYGQAPMLETYWQPSHVPDYAELLLEQQLDLQERPSAPDPDPLASDGQEDRDNGYSEPDALIKHWDQLKETLLQKRDSTSFTELITAYRPYLVMYAQRLQWDRPTARMSPEDAVQIVILKTWRIFQKAIATDGEGQDRKPIPVTFSYFQKAIMHTYMDYFRRREMETTSPVATFQDYDMPLSTTTYPDVEHAALIRNGQRKVREVLQEVFADLPEQSRQIAVDVWMGMQIGEVATKHGLREATVRNITAKVASKARRRFMALGIGVDIFTESTDI